MSSLDFIPAELVEAMITSTNWELVKEYSYSSNKNRKFLFLDKNRQDFNGEYPVRKQVMICTLYESGGNGSITVDDVPSFRHDEEVWKVLRKYFPKFYQLEYQ